MESPLVSTKGPFEQSVYGSLGTHYYQYIKFVWILNVLVPDVLLTMLAIRHVSSTLYAGAVHTIIMISGEEQSFRSLMRLWETTLKVNYLSGPWV